MPDIIIAGEKCITNLAELKKQLNPDNDTRHIPIMIISQNYDEEKKTDSYEMGADDYIAAPFNAMELAKKITTHIALKKAYDNETQNKKESDSRYYPLFKSMAQGVIYQDAEGKLIDANAAAETILGLTKEQLYGRTSYDPRWHAVKENGDEFPGEIHPASISLKTGKPVKDVIMGIYHPVEEKYRWIKINSNPQFRNGETTPYGVFVTFEDITELKLLMEKYQEAAKEADYNRNQLEAVFNAVRDGIAVADMKGKFTLVNKAQIEINGFNEAEEMEIPVEKFAEIYKLYSPDGKEIPMEEWPISRTMRGESFKDNIIHGRRLDIGREWVFSYSGEPVYDDKGAQVMSVIITRDITRRQKIEKELKQSEEKYHSLFKNMGEGFAYCKLIFDDNKPIDFTFIEANNAFSEITGMKDINGKKASEIIPGFPKSEIELFDLFCNAALMGQSQRREIYLKTLRTWIYASVYSPQKGYFISIIEEITYRKNAENALRKSEQLFSIAFNTSPAALLISTIKEGKILDLNESCCQLTGYTRQELAGSNIYDLNLWVMPQRREELIRIVNKTGIVRNQEILLRIKDGSERIFMVSMDKVELQEEECVISFFLDITERKKAEAELVKLSLAIKQSPVGVIITNDQGYIEYTNPKFAEMTGYTFDEVYGKNTRIFKSGHTSLTEYKALWDTIIAGNEWRGEFLNKKKDGSFFWENALISGIKNNDGKITHFLNIAEDITLKKNMEFELKRALEKAEESARLKSSLLANMNHEFRTPMVGILGLTSILKEMEADKQKLKKLEGILFSAKRLMNALDAVLELSNLESNLETKKSEYINIANIAVKVISEFRKKAQEKGLKFLYDIKDQTLFIKSNQNNLFMLITHLLDNAIKFTESGSIELIVEPYTDSGNTSVQITVSDTGIGIPREYQSVIFDEFRQVSEGISRSYEGCGLGLSLVKRIVKILNGSIRVVSEVGQGASFILILPAEKLSLPAPVTASETAAKQIITEIKPASKAPEILLVEDNIFNKDVVVSFLKNICKVDYAKNSAQAIEKAKQKKYSIVLMDINLGLGPDGVFTTQEIRKIPGYIDVPFVALTGYAMDSDKEKFIEAGLKYFLSKPFWKDEITDLINEILNNASCIHA